MTASLADTTWSTMILHGQPWYYTVNHDTTRSTMKLHGQPWHYMVNHDTTWSTMILHGQPWHTWSTMTYMVNHDIHGQPWHTWYGQPCILRAHTQKKNNNNNLQTLRTAASHSRSKTLLMILLYFILFTFAIWKSIESNFTLVTIETNDRLFAFTLAICRIANFIEWSFTVTFTVYVVDISYHFISFS